MAKELNEAIVLQMDGELSEIFEKIGGWLAKHHEYGQSRWTGGGTSIHPNKATKEAFRAVRGAATEIERASHALAIMLAVGPLTPEKGGTKKS